MCNILLFENKIAILYQLIFYIFVVLQAQFTIVFRLTISIFHRIQPWGWDDIELFLSTIFVKKDYFFFPNQNWNSISVIFFCRLQAKFTIVYPLILLAFQIWPWEHRDFDTFSVKKDHHFWNFIVVPSLSAFLYYFLLYFSKIYNNICTRSWRSFSRKSLTIYIVNWNTRLP